MTAILSKKVLLGLGVIGFIVAVVAGATYAAWQASDEITGNTVSTAQLAITAAGVEGGAATTYAKPVDESGVLPGFVNFVDTGEVARGIITNDSDIALDLYMYLENVTGTACGATKLAWQSSQPSSVNILGGYAIGSEPTVAGSYLSSGDSTLGQLELVADLEGAANAVKIADDSYFAPDGNPGEQKVAVRQIVAFADDADYGTHAGTCTWDEVFVGTLPGETPEVAP
jgi:predicted ribosomally synthesized peptide with SipW-like signal peptide